MEPIAGHPVPPASDFEVTPQFPTPTRDSIDFAILFTSKDVGVPVVFLAIKPPRQLNDKSSRADADREMRMQLGDFGPPSSFPKLHGISAFGSKMCFYTYDCEARRIEPSLKGLNRVEEDVTPEEWWSEDVLTNEGAKKFVDLMREVKDMCMNVNLDQSHQ
ncbi:hypothetical protein GYMLUDRAFT_42965 [Collybiopsis luxurians FD-317 M1]|uniref:Uncharacterized protein n=1 Tax=Collybiopsis luxurians FD-317 M1 TaxID=944289 RepID=A0A0D0BZM7_9AGAR|nr:hypothetical protein GYMLUDRAFT_42965 [Collybiopsis luxurians FD-317 M1]